LPISVRASESDAAAKTRISGFAGGCWADPGTARSRARTAALSQRAIMIGLLRISTKRPQNHAWRRIITLFWVSVFPGRSVRR
jgi:hypothetical protein